jgi:hypothetical protein
VCDGGVSIDLLLERFGGFISGRESFLLYKFFTIVTKKNKKTKPFVFRLLLVAGARAKPLAGSIAAPRPCRFAFILGRTQGA